MRNRIVLSFVGLAALGGVASSVPAPTVTVPREKVQLICINDFDGVQRVNFLLQDESYGTCTLRLPLALRERWRGRRNFYVIPRVSASLFARDNAGKAVWLPLSPLVNPGDDPFHRELDSKGYKAVELSGKFGRLSDTARNSKGEALKPDTVSAGGKLTVCVAPVYKGEQPCVTFEVVSRFRVYTR